MYQRKLFWTVGFLLSFIEVYIFWKGFLISLCKLGTEVNSPLIVAYIPVLLFCIIKLLFNFTIYIVIAANYIHTTPLALSYIKLNPIDSKCTLFLKIIIYIRILIAIIILFASVLHLNGYDILSTLCSIILSFFYLIWLGSISHQKHSSIYIS